MWFDNIDKMCEEAVETLAVPSAVCAIGDRDGVYYKKAFGYSRVIMNEDKPDGVFLDIVMPEVGGIEALRVMKEVSPELPVIMLSSAGTPQKLMETLKLGALDFIQKPYTSAQIAKAIESIRKKAFGDE